MANKALKSIKFPGLSDTYTIPQVDNTLAVSGAAADAKKTGDELGNLKSASSDNSNVITDITGCVTPINIILGSINTNTGADSASQDGSRLRTNYISVIAGNAYSIKLTNANASSSATVWIVYYDATKTIIPDSENLGAAASGATLTVNKTMPSGTAYIRFRISGTGLSPLEETLEVSNYTVGGVPSFRGVISTATDLNDYITPGIWQLNSTAYIPDHFPEITDGGKIVVIASNNALSSATTFQFVISYNNGIYYRYSSSNNNWSGWKKIINEDDLSAVKSNAVYSYENITTAGLNLNSGDFIHPGMWSVNNSSYLPKNCPVNGRCRIISYASSTNNSIYTYQVVIDADNYNVYERFSTNNNTWTQWTHLDGFHKNISFPCAFTNPEPYVCDDDIAQDTGSTGRVSRLYALYDSITETGVTITKNTLGSDASNTFSIYNYKVSLNTGDRPAVLLIVGEHGDELNSALTGYYVYREIVQGVLKPYLKFVDFWVVPLMNPYGYEHLTRNNYNDINLNRDFPAEWSYSLDSHNKTGNTSLSQPESTYIYNLITTNKNKILFLCNKHDTGSISKKINTSQSDIVAYTSSNCKTDLAINSGIANYEDQQVRTTDPWIVADCNTSLAGKQLIVSLSNTTPGSLDLFANAIGVHGSLMEVSGAAYYASDDTKQYPTTGTDADHRKDMARLGVDYFVNYIIQTLEHNMEITSSDDLIGLVKFYTRELVDGSYVLKEQYWNGSALVDI